MSFLCKTVIFCARQSDIFYNWSVNNLKNSLNDDTYVYISRTQIRLLLKRFDWQCYLPSCRRMSSSDPPPAWPHSLFSFSALRSMMSGRWRIFPWGEHHHGLEVHNCCCFPQSLAFSIYETRIVCWILFIPLCDSLKDIINMYSRTNYDG